MARGPKTSLILERLNATEDGMGGYTTTWSSLKIISGVFEQLSFDEIEKWANLIGSVANKFTFDIIPGITPTISDRLRLNKQVFEIKSVDIISQHGNTTSLILTEFK